MSLVLVSRVVHPFLRTSLMSRKRQLMLTTTPRLLYVDPSLMELKGEVPWSSNLKPEVSGSRKSHLVGTQLLTS